MASRKPIIASDIDGIPHCVRDGHNGVPLRVEDPRDLAEKLRRLLSDSALRGSFGRNGLELARAKYDESAYARDFETMVRITLGG